MTEVHQPVIVVGGGIAGLAAAWQLVRDGVPVRLFEAADRVGGKIQASELAGRVIDEGADAFLARVPYGIELACELGLEDRLIAPTARRAQVWSGELRPLPEPNVLGIPLELEAVEQMLGSVAASDLQADLDRTEPDPVRPDDSIGSLVRRRLGDTIHEALVDPLLGAISAGDTDRLSVHASMPQILAAAEAGPSLVESLRRQAAGRKSDAPVFHSFVGGMTVMIDALADQLADHITTGMAVESIDRLGDSVRVTLADGEMLDASAVVLACPAQVAADLVVDWPSAAAALDQIPLVSVGFVTLVFEAGTIGQPPELSGFVVPRTSDITITACSYASAKWPHLGGDVELLRVSVGHALDQVTPALPDDELLTIVLADVERTLGVTAAPLATRISRWPDAFPQYEVGHLDRVAHIEAHLNPDGVFIAGMAYRGVGIPASINSGRLAAIEALLFALET